MSRGRGTDNSGFESWQAFARARRWYRLFLYGPVPLLFGLLAVMDQHRLVRTLTAVSLIAYLLGTAVIRWKLASWPCRRLSAPARDAPRLILPH